MLRSRLWALIWLPVVMVLLLANLALLAGTVRNAESRQAYSPTQIRTNLAIAASTGTGQILGAQVIPGDARALLLQAFLSAHGSPMAPFSNLFVELADEYHFDYRLAPAIAMCESNLGKRLPLKSAYNAWGIRCYSGQEDRCKQFSGWEHAISWVMNYIKTTYFDQGITDLRDIGAKWAPPSVDTDYSWTSCVGGYMSELR